MHIPKKYGHGKVDKCPFCQKHATAMNEQKVPVCQSHKDEVLDNLKCICGSPLETLHGKFGTFFSCVKCGNINMRKALEFNEIKPRMHNEIFSQNKHERACQNKPQPKEMTVRSDDPRYFD
ncbi:hypothetical protein HYV80_06775 [Candidatus Woesearchaeota archaeon]|nr:hypothetical protein [Candidatus Woesearchaeota archaeon]